MAGRRPGHPSEIKGSREAVLHFERLFVLHSQVVLKPRAFVELNTSAAGVAFNAHFLGGHMRLCYQVGIVFCVIFFLGACEAASALAQNRPHNSHQARLYFIRQPAVLSKLGSAEVKVDGASVGSLGASSYIAVDRPPGQHTISVFGPILDSVGFEADIKLKPGVSYYFELGPVVHGTNDLISRAMMVTSGRPIPGRFNATSVYMFYSLDAAAGAASVARLRDRS